MSANLETVLQTVQKLPIAEQKELAERILKSVQDKQEQIKANLAIVERTRGSIGKGLDRETLIRLAEDDEFCGY